jgi:hypothetical protein
MNNVIAPQFANEVDTMPFWAVSRIGKTVKLIRQWDEFGDGRFVFQQGSIGVLDGVTSCDAGVRALVIFNDDSALVEIPFSLLRLPHKTEVELRADAYGGIEGRAGEIALMWSIGVDVKRRLSQNTFYRYRRQLLEHAIDISRPAGF